MIPTENLSDKEVRKLAYELQVHQIELETQNEELRRDQAELEESHNRYYDFYNNSPVGYFTISEDDVIRDVNLTGALMLGMEQSLLIKKQLTSFINREDQDKYYLYKKHIFTIKKCKLFGLNMDKRDGTTLYVQLSSTLECNSDENLKQCRLIMTDITELKCIEKGLIKSETKYRNLIETAEDAIVCDLNQTITEWNKSAERIFGYSKREIIGQSIKTLIPEKYRNEYDTGVEQYLKTGGARIIGRTTELSGITKDGVEIPIEISITDQKLGNESQLSTAIIRDITERKRVEAEINKLSMAIKESPGIFMIIDAKGNIEFVNPKFTQLTGFRPEEVIGRNPRILKSGETSNEEYKRLWETITAGGTWHGEFHNKKKDGELYWESVSITSMKGPDGVITNFIKVAEDITARKEVTKALRLSEEKYRVLLQAIPDIVYTIDMDGYFTFVNDSIRMFGYEPEGLIGKHFNIILHPDDIELFSRDIFLEKLKNRKNKNKLNLVFFDERRTKDRMTRNLEIRLLYNALERGGSNSKEVEIPEFLVCEATATGYYEKDDNRKHNKLIGTLGIIRDITEKRKFQVEAIRMEQMVLVLEMAAGLSHEINNPINGIINCAQLIMDECGDNNRLGKFSNIIIDESRRIAMLTKNLLCLSVRTIGKKDDIHIDEALYNTLTLMMVQLKRENLIVKCNISKDLPEIYGNSQELQQVFLNLVQNARFALNEKYPGKDVGKILEISGKKIAIKNREYVRFIFHDHGIGIPNEIIGNVTTPFFTNKQSSIGTGLGLGICQKIIDNHRGKMTLESVEGKFTKIIIDLPVTK
ncbi:sensor kinase [Candidatus Scalindua japonica]|uniref:histidine kinase n=1 Tax=Candidatus Scalindua japonica TaxID=1284222 RepID=A0A286TVG4_9BACT|nr:PAS domain S-box protein [Candidatus Scalindua japonica]GAX59831.1 sensor kinase [Candidatus Scalindua japonica]